MMTQFVIARIYYLRHLCVALTSELSLYITWHGTYITWPTIWGLQWEHWEAGGVTHWAQKAHAEWQEEKKGGWNAFWGRKGTTLTLIIHCHSFNWLAPFSGWKCIIWGNQLLLCFLGSKCCHAGSWCYTLERRWTTTRDTGRALRLTLIFVPSSSGSGSGIISIWEHRKQQKERESISKMIEALEPL